MENFIDEISFTDLILKYLIEEIEESKREGTEKWIASF